MFTVLVASLAFVYPGAVAAPSLEARLPTPVPVYCTQSTSHSYAMLQEPGIYLGHDVCVRLLGQESPLAMSRAAEVLYHEWWHVAFQETDERATECGTYSMLRYALRHFWGMSRARAQELYVEAFQWSPYAPLPCRPDVTDPVHN